MAQRRNQGKTFAKFREEINRRRGSSEKKLEAEAEFKKNGVRCKKIQKGENDQNSVWILGTPSFSLDGCMEWGSRDLTPKSCSCSIFNRGNMHKVGTPTVSRWMRNELCRAEACSREGLLSQQRRPRVGNTSWEFVCTTQGKNLILKWSLTDHVFKSLTKANESPF